VCPLPARRRAFIGPDDTGRRSRRSALLDLERIHRRDGGRAPGGDDGREKGAQGKRTRGHRNEYQARLFVADKALDQGRGGISRLSELTGMSRTTITKAATE
jgi:hypothetical protein